MWNASATPIASRTDARRELSQPRAFSALAMAVQMAGHRYRLAPFSEYPLRLHPQLLRTIEGRERVPIDAGVERSGVGVPPEPLHPVVLVCGGRAGLCEYIIDDFGRGPRGKAMIAADTHALFDF